MCNKHNVYGDSLSKKARITKIRIGPSKARRAATMGLTRQSPWRSLTKTPTIFNGLSFKFATFATWNIKQT